MTAMMQVVAQRIKFAVPGVRFSLNRRSDGLLLLRLHEERSIVARLPYICATVDALVPLHSVQVGEDKPILVSSIFKIWPQRPMLPGDCAVGSDRQALLAKILQAAVAEICRDRSVFIVSLAGEYVQAQMAQGADPPCDPSEMEGRTIADVCGQEAHDEICRLAKLSHCTGQVQGAYYQALINSEQRAYAARVTPIEGTELVWLVVRCIA